MEKDEGIDMEARMDYVHGNVQLVGNVKEII